MKWIRRRVLSGELLCGTFLNLGSSVAAEIAGLSGMQWVLVDLEHGNGDRQQLLGQLQALDCTPAVPLVRLPANDPVILKRFLDLGPSGVMVPWVNSVEEARAAVQGLRFPPQGIRGAAGLTRASRFGIEFEQYFEQANKELLLVAQVETGQAIDRVEEIAAVDGVDVAFIGPLDLSVSYGIPRQFNHPLMNRARERVVEVCRKAGKAAGIMLPNPAMLEQTVQEGFTFIAVGSDGSALLEEMRQIVRAFQSIRKAAEQLRTNKASGCATDFPGKSPEEK